MAACRLGRMKDCGVEGLSDEDTPFYQPHRRKGNGKSVSVSLDPLLAAHQAKLMFAENLLEIVRLESIQVGRRRGQVGAEPAAESPFAAARSQPDRYRVPYRQACSPLQSNAVPDRR